MLKQQIVIGIIDDSAVRVGLEKLLGAFGYRIEPYTSAKEFAQGRITITASRILKSLSRQIS